MKKENYRLITLAQCGDKDALENLTKNNSGLIWSAVRKFSGRGAEPEDLYQIGAIGLIKAINTYKPGKGTQLATYTARCIENEILMLLRANKKYKNDLYLSDPVGADKDGNELTLMDLLAEKEDSVFESVDKGIERDKFLEFIRGVLSKREYTVLCLRYGLKGEKNYAQREVASFLKISRSYVSRIEKKAVEKLKDAVKKGQFYC
jgi:RNA polymerase sporulation-specific sigma factor